MNNRILSIGLFLLTVLFSACGGQQTTEEVKPALTVDQLEVAATLAVQIEGMACPQGCAKPIQDNCAKLAGMAESRVEFASGMGYFTYDATKLTEKDIIACIEGTNGGDHYKVISVEAETEDVDSDEGDGTEDPEVSEVSI